ncbi:MAG TPA: DNA polymerase III subunit epsilon [Stellaceae bacterium]|nr:DNA polymerase III subunit epsilon [Stellaceae bacterium]
MREIVLDTETTGLDPQAGHRIVEIACVELLHHLPTGREFHRYVDPGREIAAEALAVHGLNAEFLSAHPPFAEMADELLEFIGADPLVIHNAEFDLAFLNMELGRLGRPAFRGAAIDTLAMARQRYPGAPASLDALCRRFDIDLSERVEHGAAIDCRLLASVYLELIGGRQPGLDFAAPATASIAAVRVARVPRRHLPSAEELAAHQAMLALLTAPLWVTEA